MTGGTEHKYGPLSVTITHRNDRDFIVSPAGRIDSDTAIYLEGEVKEILASSPRSIVFDMERVDYISSAGLGVIFSAKKHVVERGGTVLITNLQPQIKKVFDILKSLPGQNVFQNIEEADRYLASIQKREKEKR